MTDSELPTSVKNIWRWSDNSQTEYFNWNEGEPKDNEEGCVLNVNTGKRSEWDGASAETGVRPQ